MQSAVQVKLARWGEWQRSRADGVNLGYASASPSSLRARAGGIPLIATCSDEVERVEQAVARLKRYSRVEYDCIMLAYVRRFGVREIHRETRLAVNTVTARLASAERWIDDFLKIY